MGAFILYPVLIFSIFITAIMGFTDYIHVAILVHGAAQAAATAASEEAVAPTSAGTYQGTSTPSSAPLDASTVNATVGEMLNGKPYITGYSCSISGSQVTCTVNFTVSMPIVGQVNSETTATSSNSLL